MKNKYQQIHITVAILCYMQANSHRKLSVKQIQSILPYERNVRTVQSVLKELVELGVLQGDKCSPQGFTYLGLSKYKYYDCLKLN